MKGKLNKNVLGHITAKRSGVYLRFGCGLGWDAAAVGTGVPRAAGGVPCELGLLRAGNGDRGGRGDPRLGAQHGCCVGDTVL